MSAETIYARLVESWEVDARAAALESVEDYALGIEDQHFAAIKVAEHIAQAVLNVRDLIDALSTAQPDLDELGEISDLIGEIDALSYDLTTELDDLTERRARFVAAVDTLSRAGQR